MKNQSLIVNWNYPTRILVGAGRINELAKACRELGMNAPLLVTDPGIGFVVNGE